MVPPSRFSAYVPNGLMGPRELLCDWTVGLPAMPRDHKDELKLPDSKLSENKVVFNNRRRSNSSA